VAKFKFAQWLWDWLFALDEFVFEWDAGNTTKSLRKHGVTCAEVEEVFTERRFVPLGQQYQPSCPEPRFGLLGKTAKSRLLFLVFTLRQQDIRVISARPMNEAERNFYGSLRQE
jgi:uncharacterized DUF497 family protein